MFCFISVSFLLLEVIGADFKTFPSYNPLGESDENNNPFDGIYTVSVSNKKTVFLYSKVTKL